MFAALFSGRRTRRSAHALYETLVSRARAPKFYQPPFNVADTIEGRFDMIALHLALIDRWLATSDSLVALRRALRETMINDMDRSLREMGVGDMSVGKEMKKIGAALLGRLQAYSDAFEDTDVAEALKEALTRNMIEDEAAAAALAAYMIETSERLDAREAARWRPGAPLFAD